MQACPNAPMMPSRSIRLGYNVLLLDSDVIVFDNPYKYLKHPPFKDIVVINQEEGVLAPNGGVLYVQVNQTLPACQQQLQTTAQLLLSRYIAH